MLYKCLANQKIEEDEKRNSIFYRNLQKKQNNLLLIPHRSSHLIQFRNRPSTAKNFNNTYNSVDYSNSFFSFSFSQMRNKPTTPTTACSNGPPAKGKIFTKLERRKEIEKIIREESKKIYFKQRINYGQHLSVEEFRSRFKNRIPQNIHKKNLKRRLDEKLKAKTFLKTIKNMKNLDKTVDTNDNSIEMNRGIINTNKKLIRNYSAFLSEKEREIEISKKNLILVNEYFQKAEKEKKNITKEMIKQFDSNKKEKHFFEFSRNIRHKKITKKINELEFNKYRKIFSFQYSKKLKENAKIFDTIIIDELNSNLEKIQSFKDDTHHINQINYVALSNKIFLSNLIKQMRFIYIRDPTMVILRGKATKKITDLKKETPIYLEFEKLYNQDDTNVVFSRYNKIKLALPKFIRTRFKKSTNSKYGNNIDNYFGIPV